MPELPDIQLYIERLEARVSDRVLHRVRLASPFLLRTVRPPVRAAEGKTVRRLLRLGKRIVFEFDDELFLVFHLMIAGRFRWRDSAVPVPGKIGLAAFDFESGTLLLTEAGSRKRASLHVVQGEDSLRRMDPGGLEVLEADLPAFRATLLRENRTLKRALTDPRLFSGIGNAYSDEILHSARLSPFKLTGSLDESESERLYAAARDTLNRWIRILREESPGVLPEKVTAFRDGMAVHGRYRQPCPDCGAPVQRIRYADRESNYCARCQTEGKLLADRALSRLLKKDWPRRLEDLEG